MNSWLVTFEKDYSNKKIIVTCKLNASLNVVWDAFTNPVTLEKWFAPEPYKAVTKEAEFKEGGRWLYYMLSPEGEKHWGVSTFTNIRFNKSFEASDAFCDENGVVNMNFPRMTWQYNFLEDKGKILVAATITLANTEDMKQLLEMGFEEGYKMALDQLQKLLE